MASFVADSSMTWAEEVATEQRRGRAIDVTHATTQSIEERRKHYSAFRERGDTVRTVLDGLHGLAECRKRLPTRSSDVQMPRMAGWQLCSRIEIAAAPFRHPHLFLTQVGAKASAYVDYKIGVDDFIPKPFTPESSWRASTEP